LVGTGVTPVGGWIILVGTVVGKLVVVGVLVGWITPVGVASASVALGVLVGWLTPVGVAIHVDVGWGVYMGSCDGVTPRMGLPPVVAVGVLVWLAIAPDLDVAVCIAGNVEADMD
jgi:hypothetical protein